MSTIDKTLVEFDLDTLEPISPTSIQGSDSSPSLEGIETSPSIENLPTDESDYSDEGDFNFYEIDTDSDEEELPTYAITNLDITYFENDLPELVPYDQDDIVSDWNHEILDSGPQSGPFLGHTETNINDPNGKPEVFFNGMFDDRMWTILSEATNTYARSKCQSRGGNCCMDPTHPDYKKHCRLNSCVDTTPSDIKLFIAHILLMGLMKKPDLEKYWNTKSKTNIPFFGQYMSRNRFQSVLWNFHVNDDSQNPARGRPGHDALCKIRPFVNMLERNFMYAYKPSKALSFDEACCPFKGRLRFRVYNPMKPNRFHIKLFQVSEANSGYIVRFHVYTGKNNACISNASNPLDQECSKTTKIVLGLLESTNLLDKGHHVYMDNYYSSPELFSELYFRQTYAYGTVHQNRKGLPNAVKKAKLEPLQSFFLRNGPLLCLKWSGEKKKSMKKPVTILSTIHEASELLTRKKDAHGNRIPKLFAIHQYTQNMAGVDISDQYMSFHVALRKSMKWSRKLFFHFLNMVILNAYLLNKKFGKKKMSKHDYIEYIANYLVEISVEGTTCIPKRIFNPSSQMRLTERHFPKKIPIRNGKVNGILCRACNFTHAQLIKFGHSGETLHCKTTIYWCEECETPLCITPCFEIFHTVSDFRRTTLLHRIGN